VSARGESRAHPFEPQAEPVTVTVARRVAAGREADFEDWSEELTAVAANFPGFLGAGRLRPNKVGEPWHVVFRFDSALHLQDWEDSGWELVGWPLPLRIVLVSVPVTAIATWLVMPRAARLLQAWLYAPARRP